jgi:general secretion pathway protein J
MTRRMSGFTLLELLVAIGVFALFSVMAYGGLTQVLESRDRVDAERAYWTGLARAMLRIEDDLLQARPRKIRDIDGAVRPELEGRPTDTRALAEPAIEFTRGGVLSLSAGARSDLQRVGYKFLEGKLLRLTWPVLDRAPTTKPQETVLLDGLEELTVQFYGPAGGWLASWPQTGGGTTSPLPRAVEFTFKLRGRGELKRVFLVNA